MTRLRAASRVPAGLLATLLPACHALSQEPPPDLGQELVIETERGTMREIAGAPRVEVLLESAIPLGRTSITVRVQGIAVVDVEEIRVAIDGREVGRLASPPHEVVHDFGETPARHEIVATVRTRDGDVLKGSRVTQAPSAEILRTGIDIVEVSVIVKDAAGVRVRDLGREEFTVLEDGVPQVIQDFTRERTPLSLVLVLDSSGSMEGRLWSLKKAAAEFVRKVDDDVPIQVVDFDHEVRLEQEFTLDRQKVVGAIQRLEEGGGTHLWDAAYSGAFALSGKDGRRVAVVFTDGVDQSGEDDERQVVSSLEEVIHMARQERVQLYTIGLGRKIDAETLGRLAAETGGVYYHAESAKQFREVYDAILADVAAQYVVTYSPTKAAKDGTLRQIDVRLARPGLTAIHRKSYVASR